VDGHAVRRMPGDVKSLNVEIADVEPSAVIQSADVRRPAVAPGALDVPLRVVFSGFLHSFRSQIAPRCDRLGQHRAGVNRHAGEDPMTYHVVPVAVGEENSLHLRSLGVSPAKSASSRGKYPGSTTRQLEPLRITVLVICQMPLNLTST